MYRLLLFITSILISLSGFAQTPSDSLQQARKAQVEKARAAARAKAEERAAERAKMESGKHLQERGSDNKDLHKSPKDLHKEQIEKNHGPQKGDRDARKERLMQERKHEKKAKEASTPAEEKAEPKKEEKPKKPSIKERNMADTAVAKSKYGPGTFGLRGNVGATIAWGDYSNHDDKIGFDNWGFVLYGGMGYRINHICYAGILLDIEAIELLAFSPMIDFVITAPTPVSPFIELSAGPFISYNENRHWVAQPRAGLSYRGKKNKIMRFGFGLRMYDDAFKDSFNPQYAASVTAEF